MALMLGTLAKSVAGTLRFDYHGGGVTVIPAPYSTEWHSIPCLLTAQLAGGEACVQTTDGSSHMVSAGEALCLNVGIQHRIRHVTTLPSVSRWSHCDLTVLGALNLFSFFDVPLVLTGKIAQRIGDLNEMLASLPRDEEATLQQELRRQALGFELASMIIDISSSRSQISGFFEQAHRLAPALTCIRENLDRVISRQELAGLVNLSSSRFSSVFKETMGMSARDYLQQMRMQKAQKLLINSDLAIHDIAFQSGFEDAFHFSRAFKRRSGTSPSAYRAAALKSLYR